MSAVAFNSAARRIERARARKTTAYGIHQSVIHRNPDYATSILESARNELRALGNQIITNSI